MFAASVAIVKSRDMHWGLLATRDHKDISLSSLRMLLVADGANPCKLQSPVEKLTMPRGSVYIYIYMCMYTSIGSLTSCDAFLRVFKSKGLKAEAICPCASSTEVLTVSIRRSVTSSHLSSHLRPLVHKFLLKFCVTISKQNWNFPDYSCDKNKPNILRGLVSII